MNRAALDALRDDLVKRYPGWQIWYVAQFSGWVTWCARRDGWELKRVLHADTAAHLDEEIREAISGAAGG